MSSRTPPTVDEMADLLPPLVRALGEVAELMEGLVDVACQATNLSEATADALSDIGHTMSEYSHMLMREATERRRTGRGNVPLARKPDAPAAEASATQGDGLAAQEAAPAA
ncbi:hypothetical protein [Methylobacterium variabile]|jgi:hypothetical protein|uniref:hypothetical protein n=1 Tax=Methylobacterium variabile TaxID=298794 RepID=UPI00069F1370|nr:hypothetical protein [Methylobacterium variabile]